MHEQTTRHRPTSMSPLPRNMPRADDLQAIGDAPMQYLDTWRRRLGDVYALDIDGPLMSRALDCKGVIAIFGETHQRTVLSNIERFVLPVSAAVELELPPSLQNLNAGLHSMRGAEHEHAKALLARVLAGAHPGMVCAAAEEAVADLCADLRAQRGGFLLAQMRALALQASSRLLFGDPAISTLSPAQLMDYFQLRREAAAPGHTLDAVARARLIDTGETVDAGLRAYRRAVRATSQHPTLGVLAALAAAPNDMIDEDAFVAHANVLFISCNEPVAVALTWTLLALSQLPRLRARLRDESQLPSTLTSSIAGSRTRDHNGRQRTPSPLLDAVLSESLRVLTPNALMVRVTREPVQLGKHRLPADCEVLLCPFLSHREPMHFTHPQRFTPSRWTGLRPSPYVYFPFGAGGHGCVGRALALRLLHDTLAALIEQGELVLDGDTALDWRVHVMLMPTVDPRVRLRDVVNVHDDVHRDRRLDERCEGRLLGGLADIVALSDEWC